MHPEAKKLGELLVDARLITATQLQDALRHQRIAGGRLGSNLVALGFLSEDVLMDFLSQQTGVPRMDLRYLEVPPQALERIPRRLAEQLTILPIAIKEPKSLVLAMADPSDLNAIDSARFAANLNIEPVVATYTALKAAIVEQYRKLDILSNKVQDTPLPTSFAEGLPVALEVPGVQVPPAVLRQSQPMPIQSPPTPGYPKDPFFDGSGGGHHQPAGTFFGTDGPDFFDMSKPPTLDDNPPLIHERVAATARAPRLEQYQTRTLILGLIRLLQRRGILSEEELARLIQTLIDTREIRES